MSGLQIKREQVEEMLDKKFIFEKRLIFRQCIKLLLTPFNDR